MKAFVGEVDQGGLRRLVPEEAIPRDELCRLARHRSARPTTVVWGLLDDQDAEALRTAVRRSAGFTSPAAWRLAARW
jgi:hypothetical protein